MIILILLFVYLMMCFLFAFLFLFTDSNGTLIRPKEGLEEFLILIVSSLGYGLFLAAVIPVIIVEELIRIAKGLVKK